jgi:hypothetical protein
MTCFPLTTDLQIAAAGSLTGTLATAGLSNHSAFYFDAAAAAERSN